MSKLPAYVYADKDRHGRIRYRFRKKGLPSKTIKANPGTKEFRDQYNAAFGDTATKPPTMENSLAWLSGEYLFALEKRVKNGQAGAATLKQRKNILGHLVDKYGDRDAFAITPKAIRFLVAQKAATPGAANNLLKTFRAMYGWALEVGMIDTDPTLGVKKIQYKTEGFKPWTMADLRAFTHTHKIGSRAYTAVMLALCTGARRGDLNTLGPKNISEREGIKFITYTQEKGGKEVTIPVMAILQQAIDAIENPNVATFLPSDFGKVRTKEGLGTWFAKQVQKAGLTGISLHGLRKSQAALLADMGASQYEIMAVQGHSSPNSSAVYTRSADRNRLAESAIKKLSDFKL